MTPAAGGNRNPSPPPATERVAARGPKLARVHDRATHQRLRRARRVRRGALSLSCVTEAGSEQARVAFAIGRNVGGAVPRNRARRRLRAVMVELAPRLTGRAWLVAAGRDVVGSDFESLRADAESAVAKLELL